MKRILTLIVALSGALGCSYSPPPVVQTKQPTKEVQKPEVQLSSKQVDGLHDIEKANEKLLEASEWLPADPPEQTITTHALTDKQMAKLNADAEERGMAHKGVDLKFGGPLDQKLLFDLTSTKEETHVRRILYATVLVSAKLDDEVEGYMVIFTVNGFEAGPIPKDFKVGAMIGPAKKVPSKRFIDVRKDETLRIRCNSRLSVGNRVVIVMMTKQDAKDEEDLLLYLFDNH